MVIWQLPMGRWNAVQPQPLTQLLLLAVSAWSVVYARFALGPLQEAMRSDLNLTDNQIAWLQGPAVAVPMALAAIPLGLLLDRRPRVPLFWLASVLNFAAVGFTAFASSFIALFAIRTMAGLALATILVAAYSIVSDWYSPAQRGRATMVVAIGEIAGAPSAFALGGVLLMTGASLSGPTLANWRGALLWMCLPLVLVLLLMPLLREPPRPGSRPRRPTLREVWPALKDHRRVVAPLLLARIMVWTADGAVLVWGAPAIARRFELTPDRVGAILATSLLVGGVLGPLLGGPLADICQRSGGPRRTVTALAGLSLLCTPAALFAAMPTATLAGIALTVFLTLGFILGVAATALATIVVPSELRGLFLAIQVTAAALFCFGVAPLVVSGISGVLGGPDSIGEALALVCSVTSFVAFIVLLLARRGFPRTSHPTAAPTPLARLPV